MMKGKLKQLISILLISVLVLSMAAPGFAEETTGTTETTTLTVTVNSRTSGHIFELYQIFSGDIDTNDAGETVLTNIDWGESVKTDALIKELYATASDATSKLHDTFESITKDVWSAAMADDATDSDKQVLAYAVAKALSNVGDKTTEAYAFADLVSAYLSNEPSSTSNGPAGSYTDSDKEYDAGYLCYYEMTVNASGYYILMDKSGSQKNSDGSYTRYILGVIGEDVTVNEKTDATTIDKYIVNPHDGVNDAVYDDESNPNDLEKTEEYSIGDDITYQLNSNVPDMTLYNSYWFMAKDTLCEGLDFIEPVSVTVGEAEDDGYDTYDVSLAKIIYDTFDENDTKREKSLGNGKITNKQAEAKGTYTLYWYEFYDTRDTDDTDDDVKTGTELYFVLNDFYNSYIKMPGAEILITYTVRLNEKASVGAIGNENTVSLVYSNNPNEYYKGNPTPGDENDDGVGKTTEKKTVSYTSELQLLKLDAETKEVLAGATFELSRIDSERTYYILETSEEYEYEVDDENGTYVNLNEHSGGEKYWISCKVDEYSEYTHHKRLTTKSTYKVTTQTTEDGTNLDPLTATTGDDGYVIFKGLGAGIYKITEKSAPTGYNKLTGYIYARITYTDPYGYDDATKTWDGVQPTTDNTAYWSYDYYLSETDLDDVIDWDSSFWEEGNVVLEVKNTSGVLLPSTGGVGTMVFTVAGLCAMAGAVLFLYTKRRREEQ